MSDRFTTENVPCPDASWKVGELGATYLELKDVFGPPNMGPSGDEKSQGGWKIHFFEGGTYAEVYDYKEDVSFFAVTKWSIGGCNHNAVELVHKEIEEYRAKNAVA